MVKNVGISADEWPGFSVALWFPVAGVGANHSGFRWTSYLASWDEAL